METEFIPLRFGDEQSGMSEHERTIFYHRPSRDFFIHQVAINVDDLQRYQQEHPGGQFKTLEYAGHRYVSMTTVQQINSNADELARLEWELLKILEDSEQAETPRTVRGWPTQ